MPKEQVIGVERLLGFADAVIAIAITLLALGIEVPKGLTERGVADWLRGTADDVAAYAGTISLAGVLMTVMSLRLYRPGPLRVPGVPQRRVRGEIGDNALLALVFGISVPLAFVSVPLATYLWLLLFAPKLVGGLRPLWGRVSGTPGPGAGRGR